MAEHSRCQPGRPVAPGRRPGRLTGLGALPEREVPRVALAARVGVRGRFHLVDAHPRQGAVGRPRQHVEVDVARAVLGGIGVTALDQVVHQHDHLGDVARGARLVRRPPDVEHVVGALERLLVDVGPGPPRDTVLGRLADDLVVDVGDVAHEGDRVAAVLEPPPELVEDEPGPDVADVRRSLDGGPAQVDRRLAGAQRLERAGLARGGVVEVHGHRPSLRACARPTRGRRPSSE